MQLVVVILNKGERLDEVLATFMRMGVKGATVLEGTGYGEKTAYRVGRLAFVRGKLDEMLENRPKHRVVLSLVEDQALAESMVAAVGQVCSRPPGVKALVMILPAVAASVFGH